MLKLWWGAPEGDLLSLLSPLHRSWLYIYICSALWNIRWILRGPAPLGLRYHRAFGVFGNEMTESGVLFRLLISRSQHVSLSLLESLELTKGAIVPFNPSAFSALELLPLPLSATLWDESLMVSAATQVSLLRKHGSHSFTQLLGES